MDIETLFYEEHVVTLDEILHHREQRVRFVEKLLADFPNYTIVSVKCNMPGPVKNNASIRRLFQSGVEQLEQQFSSLNWNVPYKKMIHLKTGSEAFYVLNREAVEVKQQTILFEEQGLGRLFDADVHFLSQQTIQSISRESLNLPERQCFMCEKSAKQCAGRRTHSVYELQTKIVEMITSKEGNC